MGAILSKATVAAIVFSCVFATQESVAQNDNPITGYPPYEFGMTVDQIEAMEGVSYDTLDPNLGALYDAPSVTIGADEYEVALALQDDVLVQVSLNRWEDPLRCEPEFLDIVGAIQARYGPPDGPINERSIIPGLVSYEVRFTRSDASQIRILAAATGTCLLKVEYNAGGGGASF